jgi:S-formylglutathione hydrolase FrmB
MRMLGRSPAWPVVLALGIGLASAPVGAAANPLRLRSAHRLGSRLSELTLSTPAVTGDTRARVLLPRGYASSRRRYPVLYLLHGANDDYRSWTDKGDAEAITAGRPLIVVMPDTGAVGGYTDWYNGGAGGRPAWEAYHVDQLIPWIDAHYRTVAGRAGRAVAGLSMGGFGALSYAARHPDRFAAAASFSGAVDTNNPLDVAVTLAAPGGANVFGPRTTQEVRWRGHNPWDLAENLRGLTLTVRTGNGLPGGPFGGGDPIEAAVHAMSVSFDRRLRALGIAHGFDDYGPGGHTWPYWQRDLRRTLPAIMSAFAARRAVPPSFSFRAIEPSYEVYDWRVRLRRRALEFSRLAVTSRSTFTLSGSGSATVTTAPLFAPGSSHRVTVTKASSTRRLTLRVDRRGPLNVPVVLGPANPQQEYTPHAGLRARTHVYTVRVRV